MSRPTSLLVAGGTTYYQGGFGGPPTNYPIPTAKPSFGSSSSSFNSEYNRAQNIISTGAKVGIGIGVTVAVLAIISCIATLCIVNRQRTKRRQNIEADQKAYRMSISTTTTHPTASELGTDGSYAPNTYNSSINFTPADANPYANFNHNNTQQHNLVVPSSQPQRSPSGHYTPKMYNSNPGAEAAEIEGTPVTSNGHVQSDSTQAPPTQLPPTYQATSYTPGNS